MAKLVGITLESYRLWEWDQSEPLARYWPKIIELIGTLPGEDLGTYSGVLRSERLRRGLTCMQISQDLGLSEGNWTMWETGNHRPQQNFIDLLQSQLGIDLRRFELRQRIARTALADALRNARINAKYSCRQAAQIFGNRSRSAWVKYEVSGRIPEKKYWRKIKEVLDVDVESFL